MGVEGSTARQQSMARQSQAEAELWSVSQGCEILLSHLLQTQDPTDAGGDLLVNIVEARNLNKMDGRSGNSDPFCVLRLQTQVLSRPRAHRLKSC
jgi:hypothetical protein